MNTPLTPDPYPRSRGEYAEHGGPDPKELRRLGVDPASLLDFSVCTNPFGPSPHVRAALADATLEQYPDRESHALRAALAEWHRIAPERIIAGNGVSELIWLTALAFVRPNDHVLVLGPTYGEYARSGSLACGIVHNVNARQEHRFAPVPQEIERELNRCLPRIVFLCNPNNPTGGVLANEWILSWCSRHPHTLFVVDEAYQRFVAGMESLVQARAANLLVLRSMTKDYALAGLRIGYAVGAEELIDELARVRPPWSVNALAQIAALAALRDENYLAQSLENLARAKMALVEGLAGLGLYALPSATHFFLVALGNASAFRLALLQKGILVRHAASFGLPGFARLATRKPADNARLLSVLKEVSW
jgi:histidinol-phosphate aminotransferase